MGETAAVAGKPCVGPNRLDDGRTDEFSSLNGGETGPFG
jgi:hypothetical protein